MRIRPNWSLILGKEKRKEEEMRREEEEEEKKKGMETRDLHGFVWILVGSISEGLVRNSS